MNLSDQHLVILVALVAPTLASIVGSVLNWRMSTVLHVVINGERTAILAKLATLEAKLEVLEK